MISSVRAVLNMAENKAASQFVRGGERKKRGKSKEKDGVRFTVAFITGRADPQLDWMLETLAPQLLPGDEIDVLVIDMRGRSTDQLCGIRHPRIRVRSALPKPNPWQGSYRLTTSDWWAKSSAMNTALVLCETDYIVFVDDCCRLGPKWLTVVRQGVRDRQSVLAGTYDKIDGDRVLPDHRRELAPEGRQNCGGGWLYGCTMALPLEWALEVNGAEEGCDGMGAEDYIFGFMLENSGRRIDFVTDLAVTQQRPEAVSSGGGSITLRKFGKGESSNDRSHAALARFRSRKRTEFTPDLRQLRARRAAGDVSWPLPDPDMRDWYDGQLVREMK
jgi:hypothetical protein